MSYAVSNMQLAVITVHVSLLLPPHLLRLQPLHRPRLPPPRLLLLLLVYLTLLHSEKQQVRVRSKKESTSHHMNEALAAWAKVSLARADRSAEATSRVISNCSLAKSVAALHELEDISDDAYGKVYESRLEGSVYRHV